MNRVRNAVKVGNSARFVRSPKIGGYQHCPHELTLSPIRSPHLLYLYNLLPLMSGPGTPTGSRTPLTRFASTRPATPSLRDVVSLFHLLTLHNLHQSHRFYPYNTHIQTLQV